MKKILTVLAVVSLIIAFKGSAAEAGTGEDGVMTDVKEITE